MTGFFVPGTPVPKGSARAFVNKYTGRASVVQDNAERQRPWASLISLKAEEAGLRPVAGGIVLRLRFRMPRPKAHLRTNGDVKPAAVRLPHTKKPDCDKLVRLVLDALTGIAYVDDSQVVGIYAEKFYVFPSAAGCEIIVEPAEEEEIKP